MIGFRGAELSLDPELSPMERIYTRLFGVPISGLRIRLRRVLPATRGDHRRILDAGCGRGVFTMELSKLHPASEVIGVDIDNAAVNRAQLIADRAGLENCRFESGDVTQLDFQNEFDLVLCVDNLEHIEDDVGAMNSLATALIPGGRLVVHVPGYYRRWLLLGRRVNFDVPGHMRPGYTREQITQRLEQTELKVKEATYTYGILETFTNNISYLISRARQENKYLYSAVFPFLLAISFFGKFSRPKWGAGVLVQAQKP